jgi:hypothetical protein
MAPSVTPSVLGIATGFGKLFGGLIGLSGIVAHHKKTLKELKAEEAKALKDILFGFTNGEQLPKGEPKEDGFQWPSLYCKDSSNPKWPAELMEIKKKLDHVFLQHVPGTREYILRIIVCLYLTGLVNDDDFPWLKTLGIRVEEHKDLRYAYVLKWIFRMYEKRKFLREMWKSMEQYMDVQKQYFPGEIQGNWKMFQFFQDEWGLEDKKALVKELMQIFIALV